ncbi:MAG TPA: HlyC/CorC family transporter [Anaerolineae bacterium]|nr:HlyC/CorC family transporter [Anaerolineae bacterium]
MHEIETTHQINIWIPLIAGLLIIAANGFFVAVEFALVASNQMRLKQAAEKGSKPARIVLNMLKDPDRAIAAAQLGITAASILLGIVAEEPLMELLSPILAPILGAFLGPAVAAGIAGILVLLLLSYFHMVFGEQAPKIMALRSPEKAAQWLAYPMWLFARITAPFVWIVDASTSAVLRLFGVKGATGGHGTIASVEELKMVLAQSKDEGIIEEDAQEMLERVFDFGERVVREVMVPRTEIVGIERNQTVRELMHIFKDHRHSRFPIYEKNMDHIVGVIAIKDLVALLVERPELMDTPVGDLPIVQKPLIVPESLHIDDLFEEMRSKGIGLAIVIDEYGGTAGLVTREELVEEIVGAMSDEWAFRSPIQPVGPSAVEVEPMLRVDEINELLDIDLPENDAYETLAGLILYRLRHIPDVGETVDIGDFRLEVMELEGPKITRVRISRRSS